jgi:hypothetical protein
MDDWMIAYQEHKNKTVPSHFKWVNFPNIQYPTWSSKAASKT